MELDSQLSQQRNNEKLDEIRDVLRIISNKMVLPLYFLFWICDLVYVPHLKWEFLGIRASVIPVCFIVQIRLKRTKTFADAQNLALFYMACLASAINLMIVLIGDATSPYYAGLNLVALGCLTFFPWTKLYYWLTCSIIYVPYYAFVFSEAHNKEELVGVVISSFFIISTVLISFFIRYFNEELRLLELIGRKKLELEITTRNEVIKEKTEEGLRVANLAKQFSPQVVHALGTGKIKDIYSINRHQICAIFIDIVNSTDRVVRIDKDDLHSVISQFMDDTMRILLKYDITIDKFLGDGVLGFSNAPISYDDYCDRVLRAAFEIRARISDNQSHYIPYWMNALEIRIGISSGYANVGFYGSDEYFRTYTAIGKVVNLASRLCAMAEPNQILCSGDIPRRTKDGNHFMFNDLGAKSIRGFESDLISVFDVRPSDAVLTTQPKGVHSCPKGHGVLQIDVNEVGHYVFKCRLCNHVHGDDSGSASEAA